MRGVLIVLSVSWVAGCGGQATAPKPMESTPVPQPTAVLPPEGPITPVKIEGKNGAVVRGQMRALAHKVKKLERYFQDPHPKAKVVVGILNGVLAASKPLIESQEPVIHPLIGERMPLFVVECRQARRQAKESPPDMVMARALPGACSRCHHLSECPFEPGTCADDPPY